MSNIKILDCTLRDGGYINDWRFGKKEIKQIINHLDKAKIEIIEVGFLTDIAHTDEQSLFYNSNEVDKVCTDVKNSKIAAMIALGEKEIDPAVLPPKSETKLDIVRITFHRTEEEIGKAISFAKCLMEKGYKVCMQPIGTSAYSDDALLDLINRINELSPYALYLVDTLGAFYNDDILRLVYLVDHNLAPQIKLGFHSHNNLQMSFSNAQKILELHSNRDFIIDSSLFGMGRGAGNLCTELISKYTNSISKSSYGLVYIHEAIENYIYPIYIENQWGYNVHYYMAATHKCHPSYASYLMNKQTLTMNEVNLLLQNLPKDERHIFDKTLIETLYLNFQNKKSDTASCVDASEIFKDKSRPVLLLAPGKTLIEYKSDIKAFIKENNPVIISINNSYEAFNEDYIFISNNKRLYSLDYDSSKGKIIVTSNLPALNDNFLQVNYSDLCDYSFEAPDNAGMMLLRLLASAGIEKAYLAGFDGFSSKGKQSYYSRKFINDFSEEEAHAKNFSIGTQINALRKRLSIEFLTPSIYERIDSNEA